MEAVNTLIGGASIAIGLVTLAIAVLVQTGRIKKRSILNTSTRVLYLMAIAATFIGLGRWYADNEDAGPWFQTVGTFAFLALIYLSWKNRERFEKA